MVTVETTLIIIIVIITVFFGFGFLIWYAFKFEVTNFQIINNIVYLKPNKNKTSSIKILHLSDFHLRNDYKGQKLAGFIKILSLDSYDFIFITGDLSEKNELHDRLIQTLEPLKARYGIYAVFGAHDYYNKNNYTHNPSILNTFPVFVLARPKGHNSQSCHGFSKSPVISITAINHIE